MGSMYGVGYGVKVAVGGNQIMVGVGVCVEGTGWRVGEGWISGWVTQPVNNNKPNSKNPNDAVSVPGLYTCLSLPVFIKSNHHS